MKKRAGIIILIVLLTLAAVCVYAIADGQTSKEEYLQGELQPDGTVVYETNDGTTVITGDW